MVKYVKKMSHKSKKTTNDENKASQVCEIFGH